MGNTQSPSQSDQSTTSGARPARCPVCFSDLEATSAYCGQCGLSLFCSGLISLSFAGQSVASMQQVTQTSVFCRDSLYRDSLYRDSLYRDSLYRPTHSAELTIAHMRRNLYREGERAWKRQQTGRAIWAWKRLLPLVQESEQGQLASLLYVAHKGHITYSMAAIALVTFLSATLSLVLVAVLRLDGIFISVLLSILYGSIGCFLISIGGFTFCDASVRRLLRD